MARGHKKATGFSEQELELLRVSRIFISRLWFLTGTKGLSILLEFLAEHVKQRNGCLLDSRALRRSRPNLDSS